MTAGYAVPVSPSPRLPVSLTNPICELTTRLGGLCLGSCEGGALPATMTITVEKARLNVPCGRGVVAHVNVLIDKKTLEIK